MILITILIAILAILAVITFVIISVGGAVGVILFGDVIVCMIFIVYLIKKIFKRR